MIDTRVNILGREYVMQDSAALGRVIGWHGDKVEVQFLNIFGQYIVEDNGDMITEVLNISELQFLTLEEFRERFTESYPDEPFPPAVSPIEFNTDGTLNEEYERQLLRFKLRYDEGLIDLSNVPGLPDLPAPPTN